MSKNTDKCFSCGQPSEDSVDKAEELCASYSRDKFRSELQREYEAFLEDCHKSRSEIIIELIPSLLYRDFYVVSVKTLSDKTAIAMYRHIIEADFEATMIHRERANPEIHQDIVPIVTELARAHGVVLRIGGMRTEGEVQEVVSDGTH